MRFAAAHKTTSYLAVGFAFFALIGGGTVSPIISLVGLVGLIASWFLEPPRVQAERWTWVFTAVALLGFAGSAALAFTTGDYLGHGGSFLVILTVARASTRRPARPCAMPSAFASTAFPRPRNSSNAPTNGSDATSNTKNEIQWRGLACWRRNQIEWTPIMYLRRGL